MLRIKTSVEAGRLESVEDDIRALDPDLLDRSPQVRASSTTDHKVDLQLNSVVVPAMQVRIKHTLITRLD